MRYIIHQDGLIHGLGDTRAEAAADAAKWMGEEVDECDLQKPGGASADARPKSDLPVIGPATDALAKEVAEIGGNIEFREFRGCFVTKREWDAAHSETSPTAPLDMAELVFKAADAERAERVRELDAASAAAGVALCTRTAAREAFDAADAAYSAAALAFNEAYRASLHADPSPSSGGAG